MSPTPKPETEAEARKRRTRERIERESNFIKNLTTQECDIIKQSLDFINSTKSVWVLNLLKYSISTQEKELHSLYNINSFNFENQNGTWYEAGWDIDLKNPSGPEKKIKLRDAITKKLPDFFRGWLENFKEKRKNIKSF